MSRTDQTAGNRPDRIPDSPRRSCHQTVMTKRVCNQNARQVPGQMGKSCEPSVICSSNCAGEASISMYSKGCILSSK
jgi:hypothetical protein